MSRATPASLTEVCRQVVTAEEHLEDFAPAHDVTAHGSARPVFLLLTDRRLVVVDVLGLAAGADNAVRAVERDAAAVLMLGADTLRLLLSDGAVDARFPSPVVATGFRKGLRGS